MPCIPHVTRVCCMTTETFAKVVGTLGLMASSIALVTTGTIYGLYHDQFKEDLKLEEHGDEVVKGIFAVLILAFLFNLILCWSLLHGIHRGKSIYMLPWLIIEFLSNLVSICSS